MHLEQQARYARPGRPKTGGAPEQQHWRVQGTVTLVEIAVRATAWRQAKFILATNVPLAQKSSEALIQLYLDQTGVERGFAFLKDPWFLASSVFVKKVERVMATGFLMVVCLLVYRLAEHRLRQRLAQAEQTLPDQLHQPTQRPTLRWLFQCFEGVSIVRVRRGERATALEITGITALHLQVLHLLGPFTENLYT